MYLLSVYSVSGTLLGMRETDESQAWVEYLLVSVSALTPN